MSRISYRNAEKNFTSADWVTHCSLKEELHATKEELVEMKHQYQSAKKENDALKETNEKTVTENNMLKMEIMNLVAENDALKKELEYYANKSLEQTHTIFATRKGFLKEMDKFGVEIDTLRAKKNKEISELREFIDIRDYDNHILKTKVETLNAEIMALKESTKIELQKKWEGITKNVSRRIGDLKKNVETLTAKVAEQKASLEEKDTEIAVYKALQKSNEKKRASKNMEIFILQKTRKAALVSLTEKDAEITNLTKNVEIHKASLEEKDKVIDTKTKYIKTLEESFSAMEDSHDALAVENKILKEEMSRLQTTFAKIKTLI